MPWSLAAGSRSASLAGSNSGSSGRSSLARTIAAMCGPSSMIRTGGSTDNEGSWTASSWPGMGTRWTVTPMARALNAVSCFAK